MNDLLDFDNVIDPLEFVNFHIDDGERRGEPADEEATALGILGWTDHVQPKVFVCYGERGVGKTATAAALAVSAKQAFDAAGTGQKVLANFPCFFLDYEVGEITVKVCDVTKKGHRHSQATCYRIQKVMHWDPDMWRILVEYKPDWGRNALIIMDECADVVSSWGAMSNVTRNTVQQLRQIRKLECDLIATTQYPQRVASAFNEQVDSFFLIEPGPRPRAKFVDGALFRPKPKFCFLNAYIDNQHFLPLKVSQRRPIKRFKLDLTPAVGTDGEDDQQYDSWHRVEAVWENE